MRFDGDRLVGCTCRTTDRAFACNVTAGWHDGVVRTGPSEQESLDDSAIETTRRRQLGAWYTPATLIDHVLDHVLEPALAERASCSVVSVIDPACGDGRFLAAAGRRIEQAGFRPELLGIDLDPAAVEAARAAIGDRGRVLTGNGLDREWGSQRFDVVLGNPPYLNQLSTATTRGRRSSLGGGPYANAAAEFLALALRLADAPGGRVGLVLPLSILSTRDVGPIRAQVDARADMTWCWWAPRAVFDAHVRTCALGFVMREGRSEDSPRASAQPSADVARTWGPRFEPRPAIVQQRTSGPTSSWNWLITDELGIPAVPVLSSDGTIGDRAVATADFRDEYYGLAGAVSDTANGPPLVTCGLIDPGRCLWGTKSTRFAKQPFAAPRVDLSKVSDAIIAWAAQRLVPKVLVANQTRIIEAVADPNGEWLPSVPVLSVMPHDPAKVWEVAAVLTSAVASAWICHSGAGAGLSATAIRLSPPAIAAVPWPAGSLELAVQLLRVNDLLGCSAAVAQAFSIDQSTSTSLNAWWLALVR
jgi:SAM-dependent methyltransferase